jgi:uncharacterized protein YegP (UPF0339 family)
MSVGDVTGPNLTRFQIRQDSDRRYRWYLYNAKGTAVATHPEGFGSELEALSDAKELRDQLANAPILGSVVAGNVTQRA